MGNSIPADVQQAFYRVVHDFGVEKLAGMMGMSPGTLYNKANYNQNENNHNKPTLADCIVVTHLTGDKRIAQAFALAAGGGVFELPDLSRLSTDALLINLTHIQIRNGSFHHEIHEALSSDDKIDAGEFARIEREVHGYLAAILEGLGRMRGVSGG